MKNKTNPYHNYNNLLTHDVPKTLNNKIFSNLFFQLGPQHSLPVQFNEVQNIYSNYFNKRSFDNYNLKTVSNHEQFKNRIMNELNYIQDKISTIPTDTNDNFNIKDNKKETSQNYIFPTQVNKNYKKRNNIQSLDQVKEESIDVLEGKELMKPIFPGTKYIIIGKKNKHSRKNAKSNKEKCHNKFITFLEMKSGLPNYQKKVFKKNLETYEMIDKIEALKKPSFKY